MPEDKVNYLEELGLDTEQDSAEVKLDLDDVFSYQSPYYHSAPVEGTKGVPLRDILSEETAPSIRKVTETLSPLGTVFDYLRRFEYAGANLAWHYGIDEDTFVQLRNVQEKFPETKEMLTGWYKPPKVLQTGPLALPPKIPTAPWTGANWLLKSISEIGASVWDMVYELGLRGFAPRQYTPFGSAGEAYASGLLGRMKKDWFELTGDSTTGFALGVITDPLTYGDAFVIRGLWGGIKGGAKLAKVPKVASAFNRLMRRTTKSSAAYDGFLQWISKAGHRGHRVAAQLEIPQMAGKLKAVGVHHDDIRYILENGGKLPSSLKTASKLRPSIDELSDAVRMKDLIEGLPRKLAAEEVRSSLTMKKSFDWLEKLYDENPRVAMGIVDLFEKSLPVEQMAKGGRVLGLPDDFYKALKAVGVPEEDISKTLSAIGRPYVVKEALGETADDAIEEAMDILSQRTAMTHARLMKIAKTSGRRNPYELAEYQAMMNLAGETLGPEFREIFKRGNEIYKGLTNEALRKGLLNETKLKLFMSEVGLAHVKHSPTTRITKKDYAKMIDEFWRPNFSKEVRAGSKTIAAKMKKKGASGEQIAKAVKQYQDEVRRAFDDVTNELLSPAFTVKSKVSKSHLSLSRQWEEAPDWMRAAAKEADKARRDLVVGRRFGGGINDINELLGKRAYDTNIAKLFVDTELALKKAIYYNDAVEKLRKLFPDMVRYIDEGEEVPKGFARITDEVLGDIAVKEAHKEGFEALLKDFGSGAGFEHFKRTQNIYNKYMMGPWKYQTLIPFLKFHIRNLYSETRLNVLAGMRFTDPDTWKAYKEASELWKKARVLYDKEAIEELAKRTELGVIGKGFFSAEAGVSSALRRGGRIRNFDFGPTVAGKKISLKSYLDMMETLGLWTEELPRLALYNYGKLKGSKWLAKRGFATAAKYSRKFHPVYDNFTKADDVMRVAQPFWSWTRFNTPLHVRGVFTKPHYYANLERFREAMAKNVSGDWLPEGTPEWLLNSYPVQVRQGKDNSIDVFPLRGWDPAADLSALLTDEGFNRWLLGQANPFFATPVEMMIRPQESGRGIEFFSGQPIAKTKESTRNYFGVEFDRFWSYPLTKIRSIEAIRKVFDPGGRDYDPTFWSKFNNSMQAMAQGDWDKGWEMLNDAVYNQPEGSTPFYLRLLSLGVGRTYKIEEIRNIINQYYDAQADYRETRRAIREIEQATGVITDKNEKLDMLRKRQERLKEIMDTYGDIVKDYQETVNPRR